MKIIVNGRTVIPKQGFSFDYTVENRLFSGRDGYTMAITFPLAGCVENLTVCIGLSYEDFCGHDYDELAAVMGAWRDMKEQESRSECERMRVLAAISVQPHCGKRVTPSELVPLPWDESAKKRHSSSKGDGSTVERFKELARRVNNQSDGVTS